MCSRENAPRMRLLTDGPSPRRGTVDAGSIDHRSPFDFARRNHERDFTSQFPEGRRRGRCRRGRLRRARGLLVGRFGRLGRLDAEVVGLRDGRRRGGLRRSGHVVVARRGRRGRLRGRHPGEGAGRGWRQQPYQQRRMDGHQGREAVPRLLRGVRPWPH